MDHGQVTQEQYILTKESIDLVLNDRRITVRFIVETFYISARNVKKNLHHNSFYKKDATLEIINVNGRSKIIHI